MNKIHYDNIGVFVDSIIKFIGEKYINIVAKHEEASEIVRLLVMSGEYPLQFIHLEPPEYGNYKDEYYIDVDANYGVSCEEAVRSGNRYITLSSDAVFILDNCNSAILKHIISDSIYEVSIGDEGIMLPWVE